MDTHRMEYNSEKELMVIPEYGRNIQMLINHAKTIENDALRQQFAEEIIDLMQQMHPQNKNIEDYQQKLWKHLFKISRFELEVESPHGVERTPDGVNNVPERIGYPVVGTRFRHYGNNIRILINKAIEMEDGPIKDGFTKTIASYMKLAYKTWNREHYVSDEIIKGDLVTLSDGKLKLDDSEVLDTLVSTTKKRKRNSLSSSNNNHKNGRNNNRRNGGRNNYRRK